MTAGIQTGPAREAEKTRRREGNPEATPAFTWAALALGVWVLLGAIVDINAHNHGFVDETFFTPFHFLMYSGVAANGLFYVIVQFRNVGRGHSLMQALPREYLLSFAGVLLFGIAGVFDLGWHEVFGFEVGLDALISPSHLLLVVSGMMFMSGPLRAALARKTLPQGWPALFPVITSALMVYTLGTLFTQFSSLWARVEYFTSLEFFDTYDITLSPTGSLNLPHSYTMAAVLIPAALMAGVLLFLCRRMVLPVGAVSYMLVVNALIMIWMRFDYTQGYIIVLAAVLIAGLLGDWLLARRTGASRIVQLRQFAFLVPFVHMLVWFLILQASFGLWWTIHMWLGASFMAGAVGLGMASLLASRELPQAA